MFTQIDRILYPTKCEVIKTSHDFIYPIFKNGSSSLYEEAKIQNWNIIVNEQIKNCDEITVFLRNPMDRFLSGVSTFLKHCNDEGLDEKTVIYFVNRFLFINRHYNPQFFWILYLAKYLGKNCLLNFKNISDLNIYTNLQVNFSQHKNISFEELSIKVNNEKTVPNISLYMEADNFLLKNINKKITWNDLIKQYKTECSFGYNYIFDYAKKLIDVLPKN